MIGKKQVIAFYRSFKYEGYLIDTTDSHFIIEDFKDGVIYLPKQETLLKEVKK